MTSPTTAVIEFGTPDAAKECLDRRLFTWDLGKSSHVVTVEKFGKNLFISFFHCKHMTDIIPRKNPMIKVILGSLWSWKLNHIRCWFGHFDMCLCQC